MKATSLSPCPNETRQNGAVRFIGSILAVFGKEIRCELRARCALSAIMLFAVTITVAVSFSLSSERIDGAVASALLWIVIYFSAISGLSRSFIHEEEMLTSTTLKLAAPAECVYLGKLLYNAVLLLAVEAVVVPLFLILMNCRIYHWNLFVELIILGSLGLSVSTTTAAAMVAKASSRGALFAVISFPLLVPVLALAVHGSTFAMSSGPVTSASTDLRLILYYCGVVITASLMLFRYIWED